MLNVAKGNWGARSKVFNVAKKHGEKVIVHAYRDRRLKKRTFRRLWIIRINAAARQNGTTYSRLIHALSQQGININRTILSNLALENPSVFSELVVFTKN